MSVALLPTVLLRCNIREWGEDWAVATQRHSDTATGKWAGRVGGWSGNTDGMLGAGAVGLSDKGHGPGPSDGESAEDCGP